MKMKIKMAVHTKTYARLCHVFDFKPREDFQHFRFYAFFPVAGFCFTLFFNQLHIHIFNFSVILAIFIGSTITIFSYLFFLQTFYTIFKFFICSRYLVTYLSLQEFYNVFYIHHFGIVAQGGGGLSLLQCNDQ